MTVRFRNTLAVAVLFLALGAYLWFVESEKVAKDSAKKTLLEGLKKEDVSGVTLTYPDREVVLKKTGAGWRLEKPLETEADETTVGNLLGAVVDAELKRTLEGELQPLSTYGLEKPEVTVALTRADGKPVPPIHVGKTSPVGYSTFVRLGDSAEVKLVPSAFYHGMKKEVKDLRNKVIVDFKDEDVQKIEIEGGDAPIEIARDGSSWKIEKPQALRADDAELRTFLSSLRSIRAQDFVDAPSSLADYGLDSPRRRISLLLGKDNARKELLVGAEKDREGKKEIYVKRGEGDTVFAVGTFVWSNLSKGLSSFRDKTVVAFERDRLGAVEVARADGESFRLVRRDSAPAATPAEGAATPTPEKWEVEGVARSKDVQVGQLVGDLHGLKGAEIVAEGETDPGKFGLAAPDLTFSLVDREGNPIGRIFVARTKGGSEEGGGEAYAMAEGGTLVYKIRDYIFSHLDKKRADLTEPEPTPAAATSGAAAK